MGKSIEVPFLTHSVDTIESFNVSQTVSEIYAKLDLPIEESPIGGATLSVDRTTSYTFRSIESNVLNQVTDFCSRYFRNLTARSVSLSHAFT
jgi:hypothetical protein